MQNIAHLELCTKPNLTLSCVAVHRFLISYDPILSGIMDVISNSSPR